jgi:hypothetical protein
MLKHEKIEKVTGSRDDKGKGNGSIEGGCWTEAFFITLVGRRPMTLSKIVDLRAEEESA